MEKYTMAFSPCPNDTFIFDAMVNGEIDTEGLSFEVALEDVQTLNEWALEGRQQISKISYGIWPAIEEQYRLLDAGSALGFGVGPILVSKKNIALEELTNVRVAIPGKQTTAHLLFSMAFPEAKHKVFKVFHEIETAVLSGEVDAGVLIHEGRFTYEHKGLVKLMDLGAFWEEQLHCPIPLGGIVVRKDLPESIDAQLTNLIRQSIAYGWKQYPQLSTYVKEHAQEMSETVMKQHIELYVNDYSISLGEPGKKAINTLKETYQKVQASGL